MKSLLLQGFLISKLVNSLKLSYYNVTNIQIKTTETAL